jgi:cytidylate kinase
MRIDLAQYMKDRYQELNKTSPDPGPLVTIARESGCPGKKVAQSLTNALNQRLSQAGKKESWKWVGKEIFVEAAKELELEPEQVENVFKQKRNIFDQILSAQTRKFYKNDRIVLKTMGEVIRSMANDGHVIILGRGGVALTRDIAKSVHIFLEAPLDWRAAIISQKEDWTIEEAKKYAVEIDKERNTYRDFYHGNNTDYTWYDARFNCMTFTVEEVVEEIVKLMEIKKLI